MQKLLITIDKISTFAGQVFSWLIVSLTFMITYEVFVRYVLGSAHSWAFDIMLQMYGTLFMMAGAYTLSKNGMVRGDILYGFLPKRLQATFDLTLYLLFFLPGVTALCWAGYVYAGDSWAILERSSITADGRRSTNLRPSSRSPVFPHRAGDRRNHPLRHLPQAG